MNMKRIRQVLLSIGAILLLSKGTSTLRSYLLQFLASSRKQTIADSPWKLFSELLRDIKDKRVNKVLVAPNHCVVIANNSSYRVQLPPRTTTTYVTNLLAESDVHFGALQPPSFTRLLPMLMTILPFAYLGLTYFMLRKLFSDGKGVGKSSGRNQRLHPDGRTSQHISFSDVAGIDSARRELEEVVDFLRNPTKYTSMGARVPKGVLLCGPSGTGKTLLARAVASEANVAFLFCSASDFVEMLVGRGAARVRDLFTQASQHRKCIIFIDEIDALAKARGGLNSNDEREQTLNQLLTEMDGFDTFQHQSASDEDEDSTVLVIAATNRPEVLDAALLRPGRFDRHVHVGLPDLDGREEILKVHCRGVKVAPEVDLRQVARMCAEGNQRSGAQLASVVNEAAMLAVRNEVKQVDMRCFDEAIRKAGAMSWTSGDLEEIYD